MTRLRATAPSPSVTARDERRLARAEHREFCLAQAITAAEQASKDLAFVRAAYRATKLPGVWEWLRGEVARGRR